MSQSWDFQDIGLLAFVDCCQSLKKAKTPYVLYSKNLRLMAMSHVLRARIAVASTETLFMHCTLDLQSSRTKRLLSKKRKNRHNNAMRTVTRKSENHLPSNQGLRIFESHSTSMLTILIQKI